MSFIHGILEAERTAQETVQRAEEEVRGAIATARTRADEAVSSLGQSLRETSVARLYEQQSSFVTERRNILARAETEAAALRTRTHAKQGTATQYILDRVARVHS